MAENKIAQLSQGSLQDYENCRRRFYYRYILRQSWPAVESQPVQEIEQLIRNGEEFHTIVQQYLSGVPQNVLENSGLLNSKLGDWWQNFLTLEIRPGVGIHPEKTLSVQLAGVRVVAKYDLLVVGKDGELTIFDWKTMRRMPTRAELADRWQTRVYLYTAAVNAGHLSKAGVQPEDIKLVYWLANYPDEPIKFEYSSRQMKEDQSLIIGAIRDIQSRSGIEAFELTENLSFCKYCVYRSLCDRGESAGMSLDVEFEHNVDLEFSFDDIEEIAF